MTEISLKGMNWMKQRNYSPNLELKLAPTVDLMEKQPRTSHTDQSATP